MIDSIATEKGSQDVSCSACAQLSSWGRWLCSSSDKPARERATQEVLFWGEAESCYCCRRVVQAVPGHQQDGAVHVMLICQTLVLTFSNPAIYRVEAVGTPARVETQDLKVHETASRLRCPPQPTCGRVPAMLLGECRACCGGRPAASACSRNHLEYESALRCSTSHQGCLSDACRSPL